MKSSETSVFNNPMGWAAKVVGTKTKYHYFQFLTVIMGFLSSYSYYNLAVKVQAGSQTPCRIAFFIFFSSCLLPLCYLRAMRVLYVNSLEKGTFIKN